MSEQNCPATGKVKLSRWTHVLSAAELAADYELTARIDPRFARVQREFYESRTPAQLRALQHGAWLAADPEGYQMARSYLALRGVAS